MIVAAASFFGLNVFAKKAPDLLRQALERSLNKKVNIGAIRYDFPSTFWLEAFEVEEEAPFEGEISFYADRVFLSVSPMSLVQKALIIDQVEVENAKIFLRHWRGKLTHAFSRAASAGFSPTEDMAEAGIAAPGKDKPLPLEVKYFILTDSQFKYIDLDVQKGGFVIAFDSIEAELRDLRLPASRSRTFYRVEARLLQGRDQRPAQIQAEGRTRFVDLETDANWIVSGVRLPYFKPYYAKVTPASIDEGLLESRAAIRIERKDLTVNIDLELSLLAFGTYEAGNELFGLKADEILSFLKDSSGRLKFHIIVRWNLADRSVKLRDVIRRSIEHSLKQTVFGNVGKILKEAIQKINEEGVEKTKEDLETKIKKLKQEWINF